MLKLDLAMIEHLGCAAGPKESEASGSGETYEVNLRIGPAAASLLRQYKLQARQIKPSGPHNMVTKGDVLAAIERGVKPSSAEPSSPVCCLPLLITVLDMLSTTYAKHNQCPAQYAVSVVCRFSNMHVCIRGCEGSRKASLPFSTPEEEWDRISWQETANERGVVECRLRSRMQRRRCHSSRSLAMSQRQSRRQRRSLRQQVHLSGRASVARASLTQTSPIRRCSTCPMPPDLFCQAYMWQEWMLSIVHLEDNGSGRLF